MSNPYDNLYRTTYTTATSPNTFINAEQKLTRVAQSPNRYTVSLVQSPGPSRETRFVSTTAAPPVDISKTIGQFGSSEIRATRVVGASEPYETLGKSIGQFGQNEVRSTRVLQASEYSASAANQITDLTLQVKRLTEKTDQLFNENQKLKKDSEALIICRGRLEEKDSELKKLHTSNQFLETSMGNLRIELERAYDQNRQLTQQLTDMFNKNPGKFHMDMNSKRVVSAEEYDLSVKVRELEEKLLKLEKDRDRLFVENFEYKKLHGEEVGNLDAEDLLGARYQNGLQITSLDLSKAKRKIDSLQSENDLLRNELNILRGIDCFEENDVKSGITRADDQAVRRNGSAAERQRVPGKNDKTDEIGSRASEKLVHGDRLEKREFISH